MARNDKFESKGLRMRFQKTSAFLTCTGVQRGEAPLRFFSSPKSGGRKGVGPEVSP